MHLGVAENVSGVEPVLVERIEEHHAVGLLVDLDLAVDRQRAARDVEGRDVEAEEMRELPLRAESQFAHARMHAVGADDEREIVFAAVRRIARARCRRGPRARRAKWRSAFRPRVSRARSARMRLEIAAAQIDVFVAECVAHALDRHVHVRLSRRHRRIPGRRSDSARRAAARSGPCVRPRPSRCRRNPSCSLRRAGPARARSPAVRSRCA